MTEIQGILENLEKMKKFLRDFYVREKDRETCMEISDIIEMIDRMLERKRMEAVAISEPDESFGEKEIPAQFQREDMD